MKVKDEQMKAKPSYWINHSLAIEFTSMTGRSLNNINSPAVPNCSGVSFASTGLKISPRRQSRNLADCRLQQGSVTKNHDL